MHVQFTPIQIKQVRNKSIQLRFPTKYIIAVVFLSLILLTSCSIDPNGWMNMYFPEEGGAEVTLEWDPNGELDLAGYKIYYGLESGIYARIVNVRNTNISTISNLAHGVTYYFAATAYNIMGYESGFSAEIIYSVPNT